jgi:hypothetical protein
MTTCVGMFGALMVYPVFRKAGLMPELDSASALLLMIGLFFAGYIAARRRYR